jgi:hypothetical protein
MSKDRLAIFIAMRLLSLGAGGYNANATTTLAGASTSSVQFDLEPRPSAGYARSQRVIY